jgi:hypothetical protein
MPPEPREASEAPSPTPGDGNAMPGAALYRYSDAAGRVVVVDSLSKVPKRLRGSVKPIQLAAPPEASRTGTVLSPRSLLQDLHGPSFAAGASCGVVACLLLFALRRAGKLLRLGFALGVSLLGIGLYLGWMRGLAGQSQELVASPRALIEDARAAVEKMNQRSLEQARVLQELEHDGR